MDAIVVGAGLFGATIARALIAEGRKVMILDDGRPMNGSRPSGCLMKPSWFSGLGKGVYEPSLDLLDRVYGIHDLQFHVWPTRALFTVHWVPANDIRDLPVVCGTVIDVRSRMVTWRTDDRVDTVEAPLIVVAAGVWCSQLMNVDSLEGKVGVSHTWAADPRFPNTIRSWAPYKQLVAFDRPDGGGVWCGDGSAIKTKNWTQDHVNRSLARCMKMVGSAPASSQIGIRPFHKQKPCLLEERAPGLWLATGGAKNGTIAAGWAAHRIVEATS